MPSARARGARNGEEMHPWHHVEVSEDQLADYVPVVIEIPQGSSNKYELDKPTGLLRLDRVLHSAVYYPGNYGFIPRTYCNDGDPLDALIFGRDPIAPLTVVRVRSIGVMRMRDAKGLDDKILGVCVDDPAFAEYHDFRELPPHVVREMSRFFRDYKVSEDKAVVVDELLGPAAALSVIRQALADYRALPRAL